MMNKLKFCLVFMAISFGLSTNLVAQYCSTKPLEFGILLAGQTSVIDKYDAPSLCFNSGIITTGTHQVSITLPTTLNNGANSIPLSFAPDDGVYWYTRGGIIGPIVFNPASSFTTQNNTRQIALRLGGTLNVPANSQPGNYSSSIVITINRL